MGAKRTITELTREAETCLEGFSDVTTFQVAWFGWASLASAMLVIPGILLVDQWRWIAWVILGLLVGLFFPVFAVLTMLAREGPTFWVDGDFLRVSTLRWGTRTTRSVSRFTAKDVSLQPHRDGVEVSLVLSDGRHVPLDGDRASADRVRAWLKAH